MWARLKCLVFGHVWKTNVVVPGEFVSLTYDTCKRCGEGERHLAWMRAQAWRFRK